MMQARLLEWNALAAAAEFHRAQMQTRKPISFTLPFGTASGQPTVIR
eukprot:SAG31_NODE_13340_length_876_cov_0.796654_2_plen_46_part_01